MTLPVIFFLFLWLLFVVGGGGGGGFFFFFWFLLLLLLLFFGGGCECVCFFFFFFLVSLCCFFFQVCVCERARARGCGCVCVCVRVPNSPHPQPFAPAVVFSRHTGEPCRVSIGALGQTLYCVCIDVRLRPSRWSTAECVRLGCRGTEISPWPSKMPVRCDDGAKSSGRWLLGSPPSAVVGQLAPELGAHFSVFWPKLLAYCLQVWAGVILFCLLVA